MTRVGRNEERIVVYGGGDAFVSHIVRALEEAGPPFSDLRMEQPNLEDVSWP